MQELYEVSDLDPEKIHLAARITIDRHGSNAISVAEEIHFRLGSREFTAAVIAEIRRLTETTHH